MYEFNRRRGGLGSVPIATKRNIPPSGLGWTGGFTIPGNEQRFSTEKCTGSSANPMDPSSDLVCGRSEEVSYLNRIGCVPVGFRGTHYCSTDQGNQGIFFCCPPGLLASQLSNNGNQQAPSGQGGMPSGLVLGIGALLMAGIGYGLWNHIKEKRESEERGFSY